MGPRTIQGVAAGLVGLLGVVVGAASGPIEEAAAASLPPRAARASKAPVAPAEAIADLGAEEDSHVPALRDAAERRAALGRFRRSLDRGELEELAVSLAVSQDPAVTETALELAAGDPQPVRRLAAFELLDHLEPAGAVDVVLRTLARERDPELRRAALFALPAPDRGQLARVGRALGAVLQKDRDPETRRRAALALGTWTSKAGVAVLATSLRQDPDPRVRAGCAFALEMAGALPPDVIAALRDAIADPREDRLVKDNARHALEEGR